MPALTLALVSTLLTGDALAGRPPMDPQIRLHLGASATQGPDGIGLMGGMDSRMTRLLSIDVGGVMSPFGGENQIESETSAGYYRFRHALYVAPGLRIPHRQPDNFAWDFVLRAGASVTWSADLSPDAISLNPGQNRIAVGPAGLAGADLLFRKESLGLRVSAKGFASWIYSPEERDNLLLLSPQLGLEALYQF